MSRIEYLTSNIEEYEEHKEFLSPFEKKAPVTSHRLATDNILGLKLSKKSTNRWRGSL